VKKTLEFLIACTAPLAFAATAAVAQDQTSPAPAAAASATTSVTAGATVYDAAGVEVGTIKSVDATNFVIDTGKNTATMALTTLSAGAKGPVLGLTREQLDAAAEKAGADAAAALSASLVAGAEVRASDGTTVLGKVGEVTETDFVLDTGKARVKLPKTSVAKGESGLVVGMTAEQFADATRSASGKKGSK
jgi:preprotein translocase subunit YajC